MSTRMDNAANEVIRHADECRFRDTDYMCPRCQKKLEVYYCENRTFAVRCTHCETITIVVACNPDHAAAKVGLNAVAHKLRNTPFNNDMFHYVYRAFKKVFPKKYCVCQWVEHINTETNAEAWGETFFPDDGGMPVVSVSAELPVKHTVEVFAHELAHVGVGCDCEHNETWKNAFDAIYQEYMKIITEV